MPKDGSNVQLLLEFVLRDPKQKQKRATLIEEIKTEPSDSPERKSRRLSGSMAWVGRYLREDKQLLLRSDEEYWIAQPKVDRAAVEKRLWTRLTRASSSWKLTLQEMQIAEDRGLITEGRLRVLKASVYFSRQRTGS